MHQERAEPPRSRTVPVLFGVSAALLAALTLLPPPARNVGHLVVALWLAALLRALYVTTRRGRGLSIRSGWILVIALVVAALGLGIARIGRMRASSAAAHGDGAVSALESATPV